MLFVFYALVVLTCFVMCGFCKVWMCVCVGFVICGCFGNMCACIYCFCIVCTVFFIVSFKYIFVLSVLV